MIPNVLSIAGSDCSGGAGIAADLKTFGAQGVYGMAATTAVTAQNTLGVTELFAVPAATVLSQLQAVSDDIQIAAIKIGMMPNCEVFQVVNDWLSGIGDVPVVWDPVLRSTSGSALIQDTVTASDYWALMPRATVLTPNLYEAAFLLGCEPARNIRELREQALRLQQQGAAWVLVKGGHLSDIKSVDILAGPDGITEFELPRIRTRHGHGTGCTLSAAIAALLPSMELPAAIEKAKAYVHGALANVDMLKVGRGAGPLNHFYSK